MNRCWALICLLPCLLLAAISLTVPAQADEPRKPAEVLARELFEQGVRAFENGALSDACSLFERSVALVDRPGTRLNLALAELRLGRFERASADLELVISRADKVRDAKLLTQAEGLRTELASLMAKLDVHGTPEDAHLELDGLPLVGAKGAWSVSLAPGRHTLLFSRAGYEALHRELDVKPGVHETLELALIKLPEVAPSPGPRIATSEPDGLSAPQRKAAEPPALPDRRKRRRWLGASVAALAVVGAAIWVGVALANRQTTPEDEPDGPVIPVGR